MRSIYLTSAALSESERRERIYRGELIVFRDFVAVKTLADTLREACRLHLGQAPETVHALLSEAEVNAAAERLRDSVLADAIVADRVTAALAAVGVDVDQTYGDCLKQRVQIPSGRHNARFTGPLAAHRDTWGSNLMAPDQLVGPGLADDSRADDRLLSRPLRDAGTQ